MYKPKGELNRKRECRGEECISQGQRNETVGVITVQSSTRGGWRPDGTKLSCSDRASRQPASRVASALSCFSWLHLAEVCPQCGELLANINLLAQRISWGKKRKQKKEIGSLVQCSLCLMGGHEWETMTDPGPFHVPSESDPQEFPPGKGG